MKLTKLVVIGLVAGGSVLALVAPEVSALETKTATSQGKVKFINGDTPGTDGYVQKPDEPGTWYLPEDSNKSEVGPLMITNAPTLDFGTVGIKTSDAKYSVKPTVYNQTTLDADGNPVVSTPAVKVYETPFLEVQDTRGTDTAEWKVVVKADEFKRADTQAPLKGAQIEITGAKAYNNAIDVATATRQLVAPSANGINVTPTLAITDTNQTIMTGKSNAGASLTSYVMDSAYERTNSYTADSKIDSVKLAVPVSAGVQKDVDYSSTLTWTLTDDAS